MNLIQKSQFQFLQMWLASLASKSYIEHIAVKKLVLLQCARNVKKTNWFTIHMVPRSNLRAFFWKGLTRVPFVAHQKYVFWKAGRKPFSLWNLMKKGLLIVVDIGPKLEHRKRSFPPHQNLSGRATTNLFLYHKGLFDQASRRGKTAFLVIRYTAKESPFIL